MPIPYVVILAVGAVAKALIKINTPKNVKLKKQEVTDACKNGSVQKCSNKKKKKKSDREKYLGRTPGKKSKTGREVIDRMRKEGKVKDYGKRAKFKASDGKWYPLKDADMSHKTDAVTWWNKAGRKFGAKSKEVRKWMLDSDNYELDHYSINRSQGAKIGATYKKPLK